MDLNRFDTPCEGCGPDGPASPDTELAPLDLRRHMELMQEYREAIRIVTERFESLGAQARARMQHNPVHSVSSRLKTPTGIMEKLRRKGLPVTEESIRLNVRDVAGVRVVCPYLNDIDVVAEFLLSQDDVTLVARKDYVASPKESGYRSLHLVVALSLPLDGLQREVPVEVQVRTIAMDFWAAWSTSSGTRTARSSKTATPWWRTYAAAWSHAPARSPDSTAPCSASKKT